MGGLKDENGKLMGFYDFIQKYGSVKEALPYWNELMSKGGVGAPQSIMTGTGGYVTTPNRQINTQSPYYPFKKKQVNLVK